MPNKVVSLFKSKLFRFGILVVFAVAALMIAFSMMLGNEAGQFVIRVQSGDTEKSIVITENLEDENSYTGKLTVEGLSGMTDYSPEYFLERDYTTLKKLTSQMGMQNIDNGSLYVYTFYIKNTSSKGAVGVRATLNFSKVTNHLDEIIRVLTYTTGYGVDDPNIYQKADDLNRIQGKFPEVTKIEYSNYMLRPTSFKSDSVVFDDQNINIGYGNNQDYVKYSIMFWLEGNDPDSNYYAEELFNGTIRFQLTLAVSM